MKILVPLKKVPDYQVKVKVKADGSGIETDGIKWICNPFDEIAVEEALRLKEAGKATEVVVVSVGGDDVVNQLRYGMAMGADSAIHIKHAGEVDSDLASRAIAAIFNKGGYKLLMMGKQAIDSDAGQTAQLIAARLNIAQASFASKVEVAGDELKVTREVDGGLEILKIGLPAVVSTDLRLNEPRYASLPGIMKAKKKPLEEVSLESLGVGTDIVVKVQKMKLPEKRKAGKKVDSVEALVQALQNEAKVL